MTHVLVLHLWIRCLQHSFTMSVISRLVFTCYAFLGHITLGSTNPKYSHSATSFTIN